MPKPQINRDKLRVHVRQLPGEDLLVMLDRAIDLLPMTKLARLIEGYGKDNAFELRVNYGELIERTINLLVNENNADVVLVPHVFGDADESDTVACATIYAQLAEKCKGSLFCLNEKYDQHEIKYLIGQTQFFIGARMHACIAALSQTIPAVGIAYSKKFSGVFESVGVGHLIADPRHMSMEDILAVISNGLRQRAKLQEQLQATMIEVQRELLTCMDGVDLSQIRVRKSSLG